MHAIPDKVSELIDIFSTLGDWEQRYSYIIELGEALPEMSDSEKNNNSRVHGCQSQVWMIPSIEGRYFDFVADSDSQIVKGLIGLLREIYSGQTLEFVKTFDVEKFFSALELRRHLSARRGNGLREMVKKIRNFAASPTAELATRNYQPSEHPAFA
jgi:cysteine desulfuration protein SufE